MCKLKKSLLSRHLIVPASRAGARTLRGPCTLDTLVIVTRVTECDVYFLLRTIDDPNFSNLCNNVLDDLSLGQNISEYPIALRIVRAGHVIAL